MPDQYIITGEQLLDTKSYIYHEDEEAFERIYRVVLSNPYNPQAEREKVLDEFKEWVIHDLVFCDSLGADHLFSHELILDKIARMQENRRQEGKQEQP